MKNKSTLSRRKFIQNTARMAAVVSASGLIASFSPVADEKRSDRRIMRRKLGKTGLEVTILTFGGGSQFLRNADGEWEKVLEAAVKSGINLFDTAPSYKASSFYQVGDGKSLDSSEERFGKILPAYRNRIILSTKLESRNPGEAKAQLDSSLKKLGTDHVDILYIHGIEDKDKIADIESGLYKTMVLFKESGMVRNIGFSSMDSAERSRELLEKLDFDVVLLAMNATNYGDFAKVALPAARKKNTGVIAMKALRDIVGKEATVKELLEYGWSQEGVSSVIVGHYGLETLQENIRLAREFSKSGLSGSNRRELELRMASLAGPHVLSWARPGYTDGRLIVNDPRDYQG